MPFEVGDCPSRASCAPNASYSLLLLCYFLFLIFFIKNCVSANLYTGAVFWTGGYGLPLKIKGGLFVGILMVSLRTLSPLVWGLDFVFDLGLDFVFDLAFDLGFNDFNGELANSLAFAFDFMLFLMVSLRTLLKFFFAI